MFTTGTDLLTPTNYEDAILIRDKLLDSNVASTIFFPIALKYINVSIEHILPLSVVQIWCVAR